MSFRFLKNYFSTLHFPAPVYSIFPKVKKHSGFEEEDGCRAKRAAILAHDIDVAEEIGAVSESLPNDYSQYLLPKMHLSNPKHIRLLKRLLASKSISQQEKALLKSLCRPDILEKEIQDSIKNFILSGEVEYLVDRLKFAVRTISAVQSSNSLIAGKYLMFWMIESLKLNLQHQESEFTEAYKELCDYIDAHRPNFAVWLISLVEKGQFFAENYDFLKLVDKDSNITIEDCMGVIASIDYSEPFFKMLSSCAIKHTVMIKFVAGLDGDLGYFSPKNNRCKVSILRPDDETTEQHCFYGGYFSNSLHKLDTLAHKRNGYLIKDNKDLSDIDHYTLFKYFYKDRLKVELTLEDLVKLETKGTLYHEMAHALMEKLFDNECLPYILSDDDAKDFFTAIDDYFWGEFTQREVDLKNFADYIFYKIYRDSGYDTPDSRIEEIIVRCFEVIGFYGLENGVEVLQKHYPELLAYMIDRIIPKAIESMPELADIFLFDFEIKKEIWKDFANSYSSKCSSDAKDSESSEEDDSVEESDTDEIVVATMATHAPIESEVERVCGIDCAVSDADYTMLQLFFPPIFADISYAGEVL